MGKNLQRPLGHRVPDDVHERLKRLAASRGTTAGQVIADALEALEEGRALTQAEVVRWITRNTTKRGK